MSHDNENPNQGAAGVFHALGVSAPGESFSPRTPDAVMDADLAARGAEVDRPPSVTLIASILGLVGLLAASAFGLHALWSKGVQAEQFENASRPEARMEALREQDERNLTTFSRDEATGLYHVSAEVGAEILLSHPEFLRNHPAAPPPAPPAPPVPPAPTAPPAPLPGSGDAIPTTP